MPDRPGNRWVDWRQSAERCAQLLLSFAAFLLSLSLGLLTCVLAATPFMWASRGFPGGTGIDLGVLEIHDTGALVAIVGAGAAVCALAFLYASWVITGCSVAVTVASNSTVSPDVAEITRSRAVLADAFTGERRRIERELHDGAQQYLTALQLNVAALEMTARTGQELTEPMDKVKVNARQALESLRATVRGIYPQVLADKGLVAAVDELVSHSGLDHRFVLDGAEDDFRLTDTPALLLYHCTAEALTNAVKHGDADAVRVTLSDDNGHTVLAVDNNGTGTGTGSAKVAAASDGGGTGIAGLTERAAALGGTVQLSDLGTSQGRWTTRLETRLP
ncbi:MAG: sensor histidine kinase [Corynebacterium sp.]|nr:sensor histidine kinase [Corynebacterium sp.]